MTSLRSYEPWNVLHRMHDDLTRLLARDVETSDGDGANVVTGRWTPAVDVREEADRFVISADVPGVDPKAVEVTMDDGVLTIKGEREVGSRTSEEGYRRVERVHGAFHRRFSLPDHVDAEKISAHAKNGVLEITVPKAEKVKPRRIEIQA